MHLEFCVSKRCLEPSHRLMAIQYSYHGHVSFKWLGRWLITRFKAWFETSLNGISENTQVNAYFIQNWISIQYFLKSDCPEISPRRLDFYIINRLQDIIYQKVFWGGFKNAIWDAVQISSGTARNPNGAKLLMCGSSKEEKKCLVSVSKQNAA